MNRRQFLTGASVMGLGVSLPAQSARTIIDTHTHIYSDDETRYPTIPKPLHPPGSSGSLENLKRMMKENGVAGACLVQTSSFYGFDNRLICDTAAETKDWTAGVCTLDPDDARSTGLIREYVAKYEIRAMRSRPAEDGQMDSPGVEALWKACGEAGIVINVLCNRNNTDALARMLEKFDQQRVVIDHCLNLKAGVDMKAILADMLRLAKYPKTHAKLTFLATGSAEPYPFRDMQEPCHDLIAAYSPDRCVWGSSFPNELWTPKATYTQSLRLFTEELGLAAAAKDAILGGTAQRLYFRGKRLAGPIA